MFGCQTLFVRKRELLRVRFESVPCHGEARTARSTGHTDRGIDNDERFGLREVWNLVEVLYKIFHMMTNLCLQKMVLEQKIGFLPSSHFILGSAL